MAGKAVNRLQPEPPRAILPKQTAIADMTPDHLHAPMPRLPEGLVHCVSQLRQQVWMSPIHVWRPSSPQRQHSGDPSKVEGGGPADALFPGALCRTTGAIPGCPRMAVLIWQQFRFSMPAVFAFSSLRVFLLAQDAITNLLQWKW